MNRYWIFSVVIASGALAACATVEQQQQTSDNKPDKTYVTGSRIPVKDSSGSASVRSVDNKQGVDDMMQNRGAIGNQPKGGGM